MTNQAQTHRSASDRTGPVKAGRSSIIDAYLALCPVMERALKHEVRGLLGGAVLQLEVIKRFHERGEDVKFDASVLRCNDAMKELTDCLGKRDRWLPLDLIHLASGDLSFDQSEADGRSEAFGKCTVPQLFSDINGLLGPLFISRGAHLSCLPPDESCHDGRATGSVPTSSRLGLVAILGALADGLGTNKAPAGNAPSDLACVEVCDFELGDRTRSLRIAWGGGNGNSQLLGDLTDSVARQPWISEIEKSGVLEWEADGMRLSWGSVD